jgi:glyoxylase-like metal-dependent hydrolase (beta-lactamase superfamily II)
MDLGGTRLTYLPDGYYLAEPVAQYPSSTREFWCTHPEVVRPDGWLVMSVGSILVERGDWVVLIDTGTGPRDLDVEAATGGAFRGRLVGGRLLGSLATAGLRPADIGHIVYTHLHIDHTGWMFDGAGERVFPNAEYHVSLEEWSYWAEPEMLASGHGPREAELDLLRPGAQATGPLRDGIELWPTPGHTPGHLSVVVTSAAGSVVVLGDAIHCPAELQSGDLDFVTDTDPEQARKSRRAITDRLRRQDCWFAGGHFPNWIFGQVSDGPDGRVLDYPQ